MQRISEILNSHFVKDLLKDPKPTFLPYFKNEGPIITADNQAVVVETLMLDYLKKNIEITQFNKDYNSLKKKSDIEVFMQFEKEVAENIGKQMPIMHFYMYNPLEELIPQLEKVMAEENFHSWAVI